MLRGYRLAIIALGLTLLAFSAHSQEAEEPTLENEQVAEPERPDPAAGGDEGPNDYSQLIERITSELVGIKAAVRNLEAEDEATDRAEDEKRKDRDLNAQESMANWAMAMFWATVFTVFVGIGGVVYVRLALLETRRLGKIQMRGYLSCEGGKFWLKEKFVVFEIYLTNRGQSPLFNGKFNGTLTFFGDKGGSRTHTRLSGGFGSITAGSTGTCMLVKSYKRIDEGELEGQRSGVVRFHIINASARWKDVFGDEHSIDLSLSQIGALTKEKVDEKEVLTGNLRAISSHAHYTGQEEPDPTLHEKIRAVFGRRD